MNPEPITNDSDRVAPDHRIHLPGRTPVGSRRRIAAGVLSVLLGLSCGVIGIDTDATAQVTSGQDAVIIGTDAKATGLAAIAMGRDSHASGRKSMALGTETHANGGSATAVGRNSVAYGISAAGLGRGARTYSDGDAEGPHALGSRAVAIGEKTTAVGYKAAAAKPQALALDPMIWPCANGQIALDEWFCRGYVLSSEAGDPSFNAADASTKKRFRDGIRARLLSRIKGNAAPRATALGSLSKATANDSVAVGASAGARGSYTVAVGASASAGGVFPPGTSHDW